MPTPDPKITFGANAELHCNVCGTSYFVGTPCPVPILQVTMDTFERMHAHDAPVKPPLKVGFPPGYDPGEEVSVQNIHRDRDGGLSIGVGAEDRSVADQIGGLLSGAFHALLAETGAPNFVTMNYVVPLNGVDEPIEVLVQRGGKLTPSGKLAAAEKRHGELREKLGELVASWRGKWASDENDYYASQYSRADECANALQAVL